MKKVIIFDLDGTLLDTLDDLRLSVNFALSQFSYPLRTREQVRKDIGNGVAKLIERSIPAGILNENYQKCLDIFSKHYRENYTENTTPYDGLNELVIKLVNEGYYVTVATNKIVDVATHLLNINYPGLFTYIQGDAPDMKKKPNPMMINTIVSHYEVTKDDVLYIGDTNVDEETATNSEVDYALVTYGYRTIEEIKNTCRCTHLLHNADDIYGFIKSFN